MIGNLLFIFSLRMPLGANILFEPSSGGNSIYGVYTELGCKYAPGGAGTDAISLGYSTQQWGLMFTGAAGATHCVVADSVIATDRIWITGTSPTASREEGAFELRNLTLAGGVKADYAAYRLVNCAIELGSITGTSPADNREPGKEERYPPPTP